MVSDNGWDWGGIAVIGGEWWLLLIGLGLLLAGLTVGYLWGRSRGYDEGWREAQRPTPGEEYGGSTRM